jgi:transcription initiation factor TFIIIB Brf1 subunit/transcription initiation factor TFIIB
VSHYGLAIYIKKYLKAKEEELWKFKYFTMQKYNLKEKSSKRNQNPSRYYNNFITNLKFQHKPKYHVSKILV